MNIHIALYKFREAVSSTQIKDALTEVEALADKIPGITKISTGENTSKYSEGYRYVIMVEAENQTAIDAYRSHPDHEKVAHKLDAMEESGIGVDFKI